MGDMAKHEVREKIRPLGQVRVRHVTTRNGQVVPVETVMTPRLRKALGDQGIRPESLETNLVVNVGRSKLARLLGGASTAHIDRVTLGDCKVSGVVSKSQYPADLSDVALVNEIRNLAGVPNATFDLDSTTYPADIVKSGTGTGTPGTLVAGIVSKLTDTGADFVADGVTARDTATVYIGGEDYTLGVNEVLSATELEVSNPSQLAGAVGYTVQTPGTQVLFSKLISGDNFPEADFGPVTIAHEAGLLFDDDTLFNRVTFQQADDSLGLILQPTDIDGTKIDIQLDWMITF